MPTVDVEVAPGIWQRNEVTHEKRRAMIQATSPEQRFIKDGIVYLAHKYNPWCWTTSGEYLHIWNDEP